MEAELKTVKFAAMLLAMPALLGGSLLGFALSRPLMVSWLQQMAVNELDSRKFAEAETDCKLAMKLTEPPYSKLDDKCMEQRLVETLAAAYRGQDNWNEMEQLYKGKGRELWTNIDGQIVYPLMRLGRYEEAKAILERWLPKKEPPIGLCGTPRANYYGIKSLLAFCDGQLKRKSSLVDKR